MFLTGFTSFSVLFLFLYQSPLLLSTVFDSVSSSTDEVLLINSSANVFVFGDFNVHHKDWLLMELIDLVNSVIIFDLKQLHSDGSISYSDPRL